MNMPTREILQAIRTAVQTKRKEACNTIDTAYWDGFADALRIANAVIPYDASLPAAERLRSGPHHRDNDPIAS